MSVSLREV